MTRTFAGLALVAAASLCAAAAAAASPPLDAAASDPVTMGWMEGTPPAPAKRIAFEDAGYLTFPKTRWSFSHWRNFVRSAPVRRGDGEPRRLARAMRDDLDAVSFIPIGADAPMTWKDSLAANYTDGVVVLHKGRIVYERYFGVTTARTTHIAFSVTKSFVGTIAASLIAEGALDPQAPVSRYVPELAASGFGDATVRQVLDMTTAVKFDERYGAIDSAIARHGFSARLLPRPADYQGPEGLLAFAVETPKDGVHGGQFTYRTLNTDVLGWVIARVTGKPLDTLLEERIWSPLGMEADAAIAIDGVGTPFGGGGLMASLRDIARFGDMMRLGGRWKGKQIVPAGAVADILTGGDKALFARNGAYPTLPGWSYRNQWWVSHNSHGAFMARGIYGQAIYIDPKAEMVIARFASHPVAGNVGIDPTSLPAYEALAEHLMR